MMSEKEKSRRLHVVPTLPLKQDLNDDRSWRLVVVAVIVVGGALLALAIKLLCWVAG